jgi:hypothetical protein
MIHMAYAAPRNVFETTPTVSGLRSDSSSVYLVYVLLGVTENDLPSHQNRNVQILYNWASMCPSQNETCTYPEYHDSHGTYLNKLAAAYNPKAKRRRCCASALVVVVLQFG